MKNWNVYKKAGVDNEVVKEGFNWWAFFFPGIWALLRGLTWHGLVALAIQIATGMPTEGAIIMFPVALFVSFLYGFKGNAWVCSDLEKKGYQFAGTVRAASKTGAIPAYSAKGE